MRAPNVLAAATLAVGMMSPWPALAQAEAGAAVAHTVRVTGDGALLRLELADGSTIDIQFADGSVLVDGERVAAYADGNAFARAWSDLLARGGSLSTAELMNAARALGAEGSDQAGGVREAILAQLQAIQVAEAASVSAQAAAARAEAAAEVMVGAGQRSGADANLDIALDRMAAAQGLAGRVDALRISLRQMQDMGFDVQDARVSVGDLTVARDETINRDLIVLAGDLSVFGRVNGNVVALEGDVIVRPDGIIDGDVVTVQGTVIRAGGEISGRVREQAWEPGAAVAPAAQALDVEPRGAVGPPVQLASLLGMFFALACIGFGFAFFMPQQLEVVADTVTDSFGKSFLAGMFAQPLLIPAFLVILAGLCITVVGVLLIPIAVFAFVLAVVAAGVGGYLAVARSVGGRYLTRRMAQGHAVTITPYRSIVFGLIGLAAIWAPAVLLGWIPLVGNLLAFLAAVFTWIMATAGFGAAILSRAGLHATLVRAGRLPALTDEHYWGTGEHDALPPRRSAARSS